VLSEAIKGLIARPVIPGSRFNLAARKTLPFIIGFEPLATEK